MLAILCVSYKKEYVLKNTTILHTRHTTRLQPQPRRQTEPHPTKTVDGDRASQPGQLTEDRALSTQEVGVQQIVFVDDLVAVDDFDTFVVNFKVFVNVQTRLIVEEEFGAANLAHRGAFASILHFG